MTVSHESAQRLRDVASWGVSLLLLFGVTRVLAASLTLAWNPVASPSVAGYMLHYGSSAGNYVSRLDVGGSTQATVPNLIEGATYHFAVTAYDASHVESPFSNDVSATIPSGSTAPVANFTASTTSGTPPLALNFTNTSTGTIAGYQWSFGDGTTSTVTSPSHVYAAAGTYTVSLTVTGPGGSNTKTASGYIRVSTSPSTPSAASTSTSLAASPNPSPAGALVTFTATVTGNAPSGTVQFTDSGAVIAGCGAVAVSASAHAATCTTSSLAAGTHAVVAKYSGNPTNAASASAALSEVVSASGSINVALASNGGVASASSTYSAGYAASGAIDGRRSGAGWGVSGGWNDGTRRTFPDWLQVAFNGTKTIDHVVVYSLQDNYQNPVEPTDAMTFSLYGLTAFQVQGWNGSAWVTLGSVSGNNLVKRTVAFSPFTTDRVRINVTGSRDGNWSRIAEVEAWTATGTNGQMDVALAANGSTATASSTHTGGYAPAGAIDGVRSGAGWGVSGGWNDATSKAFPDWLQINFNTVRTIDHVVLYSVQDNYQSPAEPTDTMTFARYGLTSFDVQAWNGTAWVTLASVRGNNLVKRTVWFPAYATDRIRISVLASADATWSRIAEVEAWGK